jgi:DNA-binding protein YbaB
MSEPGPEFDPETMFRETRAQFDQVAGMQGAMAELRGRAESRDGRVRAVYAQDQGLAEVELDPRAMRMSAAELGQVIVEVSGEAKRDLERQIKELMDETLTQQDLTPDDLKEMFEEPSGLTETLGSMGKIFDGATKEVEGILDQIRRMMGTTGAGAGTGTPAPGNVPGTPPPPPGSSAMPMPPGPPVPPTPGPEHLPGPPPVPPWVTPGGSGDPWPWGGKPPEADAPPKDD